MWWLIKSNGNDNDESETGSNDKENYKTSNVSKDKECVRNDDNDNKEQGDDIENYIYDCKGEGITSNPRSSR